MRKISVSSEEANRLRASIAQSKSPVVFKQPCECILLASNLGLSPVHLVKHFPVTRKTIYHWFDLWDKSKLDGLRTAGGQGSKKKLASICTEELKSLLEAKSQNLKEVLSILSSKYKIEVSKKTLIRFLKR